MRNGCGIMFGSIHDTLSFLIGKRDLSEETDVVRPRMRYVPEC
jgi:hypothetical protein